MIDARKILQPSGGHKAVQMRVVTAATWPQTCNQLPRATQKWADAQNFTGAAGSCLHVPNGEGAIVEVIVGSNGGDGFKLAWLCRQLPPGTYAFQTANSESPRFAELAWCLEAYGFDRYKAQSKKFPRLVCGSQVDYESVIRLANATYMVRDLINTPSNDFGPAELEAAARNVASLHKAKLTVTSGDALKRGFPMIHDVGKASPRQPRLIDFSWGSGRAPKVTLVGKGVCFDTGGLDIKAA